MDDKTLIANLKNDLSKLEKEIANQNEFIYKNANSLQIHNQEFEAYRIEQERNYKILKHSFIELLEAYLNLKRKVINLSKQESKNEEYAWYEKSGLL